MNVPQAGEASLESGQEAVATGNGADLLGFDLVSLTSSAGQLRAGQLAFAHDGGDIDDNAGQSASANELEYPAFRALVNVYASALRAFGLQPGERILICGCLGAQSQAAIMAGLTAGLDTALVGIHLDADDIGDFARLTGASAVLSEASAGEPGVARQILTAASQADSVRIVISLSDDPADGMVPIHASGAATGRAAHLQRSGQVITRDMQGAPVIHSQQTLVTAGLDFIARAKISAGAPIVSTIVPASFAGLVCGPVTGLLTGAPVILHAPFDSTRLIERVKASGPVQLIAPGAISEHLTSSTILNAEDLSLLVLLSRFEGTPAALQAPALPALAVDGFDVCDLAAWDELALAANMRAQGGGPRMPLEDNHVIHLQGRETLALRAVRHLLEKNGIRSTTIAFDGAAVSQRDWKFYDSAQ